MAASNESVSMLTEVLSSAVVSAFVNTGWNALSKLFDHQKEADKEKLKVDHIYLELAAQLENFARQCNGRLYDIRARMESYRHEYNHSAFDNLPSTSFNFSPEPTWGALPIPFVAQVKALPNRFEQCNLWINDQAHYWADIDEAYEFEEERLSYYSLKACNIASSIRKRINAGDADISYILAHFQSIIDSRRTLHRESPETYSVIPELQAQFESENRA